MKLTGGKGSPLFVGTTLFVHVDRDACDNIDEYAATKEVDILARATFILSPAKMLGPSEINFRAFVSTDRVILQFRAILCLVKLYPICSC